MITFVTRRRRSAVAALAAVALAAGVFSVAASAMAHKSPATSTQASEARPPAIKHVWVITLENESFGYTFGKAGKRQAPYLTKTLTGQGALLKNYYGVGHDSLDNYTAMVSGQAPNYTLNEDCGRFYQFQQFGGENYDKWTKFHQLSGQGCVFPRSVKTIANQLTAKHLGWKAYEQDMGNDPHRDGTVRTSHGPSCGHPKINGIDYTDSTAPANDSYATRHDPFVYFHSVIDHKAYCRKHVVSLHPLAHDLKKVSTTPAFSFITPNTCADGHDIPKCQDGTKGGLVRVNTFLKRWIPAIEKSPAYQHGGLIVINFDESGSDEDAGACCGEVDGLGYDDPSHPNINEPGLYGPGGGRVGAVLLSRFIKPGTVSNHPYNHYSLLRSIEDVFHLGHLGDAQQPQVHSFGSDVYTRRKG